MTKPIIGFAGLTHLGLNSLLAAAAKGFETIGWDDAPGLVDQLLCGDFPINEPEFEELYAEVSGRIHFTATMADLARCDVIYLAIDVPTDHTGTSDLASVEALLKRMSCCLGPANVVVILSQVPPGFTASMQPFFASLYYQVETLVFGRAVERATNPERLIVGLPDTGQKLPEVLIAFLESFTVPILTMRYASAEFCKIAINCFLVADVTTTNALASVCEKIGADWDEISPALRLDARIGQLAYLKPGLGISGGNLERDLRNVVEMAMVHDVDVGPIQEYRRFSDVSKDWAWHALVTALGGGVVGRRIAVLGLAYKENTHSTKNSPSLRLISMLGKVSDVRVYDPVVQASVAPDAIGTECIDSCLDGAEALCIMTPWDDFKGLSPSILADRMSGTHVIDPYGLLDGKAMAEAGLTHYVRGRPPA